jgi:DNA-binding MurR/RpiR family transcriptional regulator
MNAITTERIESLIISKYKGLSRNQRKVADYILKNLNESAFLSVIEIGEKCGASKATVVRFAQSIGYDGFIEFRNAIHKAVQSKFAYLERFPLVADSDKETIYEVAQKEVKNINQTMESLNLDTFKEIIHLIQKAGTVYTFGQGFSALLSQLMAYSFNQIGVRTHCLVSSHLCFEEQIMYVNPNDVIVCFSFPPYSKRTIEAAKIAMEKGIHVVALTDSKSDSIVGYAHHSLFIQSENMLFTNSFAAISVTMNAIITELSVRNKDRTVKFINEVNDLFTNDQKLQL